MRTPSKILIATLGTALVVVLLSALVVYREVRERSLGSVDVAGPAFDVRVESWSQWNGLAARTGRHEILVRSAGESQWRPSATVRTRLECLPSASGVVFAGAACGIAIDHVVACTPDGGLSWGVTDFGTITQGPARESTVVISVRLDADGAGTVTLGLERSPATAVATSATADFGRTWGPVVSVE
ncbi:MAG: hypothetical protein JNM94_06245 [Phycisphaerae bacterium]|nr:hypothetical protein [Phycisphaerae bacterium]